MFCPDWGANQEPSVPQPGIFFKPPTYTSKVSLHLKNFWITLIFKSNSTETRCEKIDRWALPTTVWHLGFTWMHSKKCNISSIYAHLNSTSIQQGQTLVWDDSECSEAHVQTHVSSPLVSCHQNRRPAGSRWGPTWLHWLHSKGGEEKGEKVLLRTDQNWIQSQRSHMQCNSACITGIWRSSS